MSCSRIVSARFMRRCVTTANPLIQRRALAWMLLKGHAPFSSRVCTSKPCPTYLPPARVYPPKRAPRCIHPSSAIGGFHNAASCLGVASSSLNHRCCILGCSAGSGHQREPFLCSRWHSRAGIRTQAHSSGSDVAQQQAFVHKCVVGQLPEELGNGLADSLLELGAAAATVERSGGQGDNPSDQTAVAVIAFFTEETSQEERDTIVRCSTQMVAVPEPLALSWSTVLENEWLDPIKAAFRPIEITPRLWIVPQPDTSGLSRAAVPDDAAVKRVLLQPSTAWGDGCHPTTRMIVHWLNSADLQGMSVLDYGCGTGILGITGALLGAHKIVGLDIEPDAVHASEHNAQLNGVEDRCWFYACEPVPPESPSESPDSYHGEDNSFDLCLANIFQKDLINLRDSICRLVRPGGKIVMSGLLQHQADDVLAAYEPVSCSSVVTESEGWVMICAQLHSSEDAKDARNDNGVYVCWRVACDWRYGMRCQAPVGTSAIRFPNKQMIDCTPQLSSFFPEGSWACFSYRSTWHQPVVAMGALPECIPESAVLLRSVSHCRLSTEYSTVEEPARWACSITRPSITPSDFCALVKERATTSAPSGDTHGNNSTHPVPEPSAGIQLKHSVPEYLDAFRTLHATPRPCKHWLGSKWQRQLAEQVIEQKKKPGDGKAQQGTGAECLASKGTVPARAERAEPPKASGPSTVGMSHAFMDQLKTRRRDELKKAQGKAAEERREKERVAQMNAKVLEAKRAKLDSLNRHRAANCTLARQQLASKVEAAQALTAKLECVTRELAAVEVDKHHAVTQLKAKRAEPHLPRHFQTPLDADAILPAGLAPSNGSTLPKPPVVGAAATPAADGLPKQEGHLQNNTMLPSPRADGEEGGMVLALGVIVNAPTFPPASGFIVPRLFGSHQDIDLKTPQGDFSQDIAVKPAPHKRKRFDDKPDVVQNKVLVTAAGLLPPPQPLASTPLAGKSTLPPAPITNGGPGSQGMRLKRPDPPGQWPVPAPGGGFSYEPRPRVQGSDVFGGVRGSSGADRRPEKGSFIGRPAGMHDQAPGFLPKVRPEEGDDLLSARPGFTGSKPGGMMAEGLKPLPPVGSSHTTARSSILERQPQLLPPPPVHSMTHSDDVPPPPLWNFGSRLKKEDKGGE